MTEAFTLNAPDTTASVKRLLNFSSDPITPADIEILQRQINELNNWRERSTQNSTLVLPYGGVEVNLLDSRTTISSTFTDVDIGSITSSLRRMDAKRRLKEHEPSLTVAPASKADLALVEVGVPVYMMLYISALFCLVSAVGSFSMWLFDLPFLVNPFAAFLMFVLSPFIFAMGRAARRD